ncbi:MAG TPA: EamA family transporter [Conexibacter sp.]|jgi:drug/metabolite transporter (DMT)-like permease
MSPRAWAAFAAMSALWGIPYLFIKIAVDDGVPPAFVAWSRVVLGALVLLPLAWRMRALHTVRGHWRWIVVYAVVEISLPFPLIAFGETRVSSSTTAIAIATVPLIASLLALRFAPGDRLSGRRLAGMLVGFAGVAALVGIDVSGSGSELLGIGAIVLAAVGYAFGPLVMSRGLSAPNAFAAIGSSLAVAAVVLAPLAAVDHPTAVPPAGAIASIVVLGLLCTAAAFVVFSVLIKAAGPTRSTIVTYINPVIALGLGIAFLSEAPGAGAVAGLALILAGSWLSTDGRLPARLERRLAGASAEAES